MPKLNKVQLGPAKLVSLGKRNYKSKNNRLGKPSVGPIETAVVITILVLALISIQHISGLTGFAVSDEIVGLPADTPPPSETIPADSGSEVIGLPQEPSDSGASSGGDEVIGLPVGETPVGNETTNETEEIVGTPEDEIVGAQADCGATTQTSVANGDWNNTATWSGTCTVDSTTNVIVKHTVSIVGTGFNASAIGIDAGGVLQLLNNQTTSLKNTGNFTINAGGIFSGGANNIWLTGVNVYGLFNASLGNTSLIEEGSDAVLWRTALGSKFNHNNGMVLIGSDVAGGSTTVSSTGNSSNNFANLTINTPDLVLLSNILNITGNLVVTQGSLATTTGGSGPTVPVNVTGTTLVGSTGIINLGFGGEAFNQNDWSYFGGDVLVRNTALFNTSKFNTTILGHLTIENTGEFRTNGNVTICERCQDATYGITMATGNNGTFNAKQSSGNISIGSFYVGSGSTFNTTSGTTNLTRRQSGGTTINIQNKGHFDHNNGDVSITQTVGTTLIELRGPDAGGVGGLTFNNFSQNTGSSTLLYNAVGDVGAETNMFVLGNFNLNQATFDVKTNAENDVNVNVSGTLTIGSGTTFLGEYANISAGILITTGTYNATTKFTNIHGNAVSGQTKTIWNTNSGTFNHNNGIVRIFSSGAGTHSVTTGSSAKPFYDLYFLPSSTTLFYSPSGGGSFILEVRNNLSVGRNATLASSNGNRIYDLKDVSISTGGVLGDDGAGGATVSRFNATGAIQVEGVLDMSLSNWTVTNIGSITVASGGTYNATNRTTLFNNRDAGTYLLNIQSGGIFKHNRGNIRTDYVNVFASLATNNQTFYDFTINQGVAELRLQGQNDFHIANNLTIEGGNLTMGGNSAPYGLLNVTGAMVLNSGGVYGWMFPAIDTYNRNMQVGSLTIQSGGFYNATTATTNITSGNWSNSGSFLHNSGRVVIGGGTGHNQSITGATETTFFNLNITNGANNVTLEQNTTIGGVLDIASGSGVMLDATDKALVVTFGNASGGNTKIINSGTVSFAGNKNNFANILGAKVQNPINIVGTDWDWDAGGSGSIVNISNVDYQIDATTGGGGVTVVLSGDSVNLNDFTVSAGDTLNATKSGLIITVGNDTADQLTVKGNINLDSVVINSYYALLATTTTAVLNINNISVRSVADYGLQISGFERIRQLNNSIFRGGSPYAGIYIQAAGKSVTGTNNTFIGQANSNDVYGQDILLADTARAELTNSTFSTVGFSGPTGWLISRDHNKVGNNWTIWGMLNTTEGNSTGGYNGTNWTSSDTINLALATKYSNYFPTSLNASNNFVVGNMNISNGTNLIGGSVTNLSFGSLVIASGGLYNATRNNTIITSENAAGLALDIDGTFIHNNGTVNITTTANTTADLSGTGNLYTLSLNMSNGTSLILLDNANLDGNLRITSGILDTNISHGFNFTAVGFLNMTGVFQARNSSNITIDFVSIVNGMFNGHEANISFGGIDVDAAGYYNATKYTTLITGSASNPIVPFGVSVSGNRIRHNNGTVKFIQASDSKHLNISVYLDITTEPVEFYNLIVDPPTETIYYVPAGGANFGVFVYNNFTIGPHAHVTNNQGLTQYHLKSLAIAPGGSLYTKNMTDSVDTFNVTDGVYVEGTLDASLAAWTDVNIGYLLIRSTGVVNASNATTNISSQINNMAFQADTAGSFKHHNGTIRIRGTALDQHISAANDNHFYNLVITKPSGVVYTRSHISVDNNFSLEKGEFRSFNSSDNYTITGRTLINGTFKDGAYNSTTNDTFGGLVIQTNGTFITGGGNINITNNNWTNNGAFRHNSSSVFFGRNGLQYITGTNTTEFFNVNITNTVSVNQTQNITIDGVLDIASGARYVIDATNKNVSLTFGNTSSSTKIINSGIFAFANNTGPNRVILNGSSGAHPVKINGSDFTWGYDKSGARIDLVNLDFQMPVTISSGARINVIFGNTSFRDLTISVNDHLNISSGANVTIHPAGKLSLNGKLFILDGLLFNATYNLTTFTANASNVFLSPVVTIPVDTALEINNLNVSNITKYVNITNLTNSPMLDLNFTYNSTIVSANNESKLTIYKFNDSDQKWYNLSTTRDTIQKVVSITDFTQVGSIFSEALQYLGADTITPIITNIAVINIAANSATITWTTDESANSSVNYGVTDSLGATAGDITLATAHSINLAGLIDGVTYYYNVTSCDAAPNCNITGPLSFSTVAVVAPPAAEPTVGGGTGETGGTSAGFLSTPGTGLDISETELRLTIEAGSSGSESVLLTNYATVPIEIALAKQSLETIPVKAAEKAPEVYFANEPTAQSRLIELQDSDIGFSETKIIINPGETKQLNILFEPLERGVYTGSVIIKWGLVGTPAAHTVELPVILEVGQIGKLFDISLNIPSTFKKLFSGNTLRTQVNLLNVGPSDEMKDVTIDYTIKDFENNILHKESETVAVGRDKSYLKSIELPELETGKYVLIAELTYGGEYASASNTFEIVTTGLLPAIMQKPEYLAGLAGLIVIVIILANARIIYANRRRSVITSRRKSKSHKARRR